MHSRAEVLEVMALRKQYGFGARRIAARTGLPVATVRDWLAGKLPAHSRPEPEVVCRRCGHAEHAFADLSAAYVYLLGLYLGDGSIATSPRSVYRLRISLDARYPKIIEACADAIREVLPRNRVGLTSHGTWFEVWSYSKSWPCLFPQHGPGKKHERPIRLTRWQRELVAQWPKALLRGLVQSDGYRFRNTGRKWSCPRYGFVNHSRDIREIFCTTCEQIGVRWTSSGAYTIYVSRKADVAILDEFIGPKR